jgi:hypothetical protein
MDHQALADILFPHVTDTPEMLEERFPLREVPEGAVITRMAPSPTGFVHLGNLVQGLTSERMAHQSGGVLFLRVEDTDAKREVPGAVEVLIETLKHYGIHFDEGATIDGDNGLYGPYRQRQRAGIYHVYAKKLVSEGQAYPCFCTEEQLAAMRETDGFTGVALRYMLPFIKTPYNILGQGLRKGPLGILNLGWKTGEILSGKRKADAQYIGLVAEQLLAYGALMAIYSLSGDDDELPFITGANAPYGSAEYGFKANKIPANSIRIGNSWFSYAKIEPLATGLSAIADAIQAIKDAKNGKTVTQAISDVLVKTGKVISDKSFIDSIGEIYDMVQDPERNISKPVNNLLASAMPNIYRQIRHSLLDTVQDSKSREKGFEFLQEQFMIVGNRMGVTAAVPKIDYFGREVKKDAFGDSLLSAAGRLISPVKVQSGVSDMDKAETLVWNYNQRNPDEAWYPSIPRNTFTVNKKKLYLAGDDYRDYAVDAGKLAHRQINNAIRAGYLNVNNPDKKDIDLIKKIFTRARKETQQKYIRKAKEF